MLENKQLQSETLGELLAGVVQQPAQQPATKKTAKKAPIVRLPKVDEVVVFASKVFNVVENDAESEEGEKFVVLQEYKTKRGQCLVIPTLAFFEEYESTEYLEGEKTGKVFHYTPNKKDQTITFFEKSKAKRSLETSFYYPTEGEAKTLLEAREQAEKERKAKRDARKAEKQAQKEADKKE